MLNVKKNTIILSAAVLVLLSIDVSLAQTTYGSQLMSQEEWAEHRTMMRSLPPKDREAYRAQHHKLMKERAASMGLALPDQPPTYGRNFVRGGPGYGYGRRGPGPGYGYGRRGPEYWGPRYDGWYDR